MSHNGEDRRRTPLTRQQLDLIAEETRRAAAKAVKRYRNSAIVAFVLLVAALGYVDSQNAQDRKQIREYAAVSAEATRDSLARSVRVACQADATNATALRSALDGQINFVRQANEPPPPTVEERVAAIRRLRNIIVVPDCDKRVAEALDNFDRRSSDGGP